MTKNEKIAKKYSKILDMIKVNNDQMRQKLYDTMRETDANYRKMCDYINNLMIIEMSEIETTND